MTDKLFQINFDATMTGEFDEKETKQRFKKLFGLKQTALDKLFSGKDITIKTNLSEDDALQYAMKIAQTGCECVIERMIEAGLQVQEENRSGNERRLRHRRDPRASSILPDRRQNIRRQEDAEYVEELISNNADIPAAFQAYPRVTRKKDD